MLARLGKVFMVAVPLSLTGVPGGLAFPEECAGAACESNPDWVCCRDSGDCSDYKLNYCNLVAGSDPFDQECGWN